MNQDRPTLGDLLRTSCEFVESIASHLPTEFKYDAQVAVYLLNICEREAMSGAKRAWEDNALLASFLHAEGSTDELTQALCGRIRNGECDAIWDETMQMVLALVVSKVGIVRPDRLHPIHAGLIGEI